MMLILSPTQRMIPQREQRGTELCRDVYLDKDDTDKQFDKTCFVVCVLVVLEGAKCKNVDFVVFFPSV